MFLAATMRRMPNHDALPLRVRNLSSTGLCADSKHPVELGERLTFDISGIGRVDGEVVWREADRFGAAFASEVDPARARRPLTRPAVNADILPPVRDYRRPGLHAPSRRS